MRRHLTVLLFALAAAACGSDAAPAGDSPGEDAALDSAGDATNDDVAEDVPAPDAGGDDVAEDVPAPDAGGDDVADDVAAPDAGPDTSDAGPDTSDVGPDTADVGPDTADVGPDTSDVGPDTPDVGPDTADVGPDTADVGPDTSDVGPDTPDVGPDTADVGPDTADVAVDVAPDVPPEGTPIDPSSLRSPPYLMWVTEDGVSVRWETSEAVRGEVRYGFAADERWYVVTEDAPVTSHEVRLSGLPAGTTIYYGVGEDGRLTPSQSFRTAPEASTDAAFSFVVWGDNQNGPDVFETLTPAMADLDPDFAMSTGDCVQNGTRGEYRSQLFDPIAPLGARVPFLIAAGNHERYSDSGAALFNEYMSQPGDEHCFGWRYGSLYIVFIDTELSIDPGSPQNACITAALTSEEATSARFQAAAFHKPPRIEWWFGGRLAFPDSMEAPQVREILEPLLESLGVDIVFNGHNHLYAHTPETPGGITWVTTGGAGGMIDTRGLFDIWRVGTWPQIETTIHENHYLYVLVDGDTMTVTAIDRDRAPLHEFTVTR